MLHPLFKKFQIWPHLLLMGIFVFACPSAMAATAAQTQYEALPDLHPAESWVGNSFSGAPRPHTPLGEFFPLAVEDIAVAPDGTVAVTGSYNEIASSLQVYRNGVWVGTSVHRLSGFFQHAAAAEDPDGQYLFMTTRTGAGRFLPDGKPDAKNVTLEGAQNWPKGTVRDRMITGIAVRNSLLYLSDQTPLNKAGADPFNGIRILDKNSLQPLRAFSFARATKLAVTQTGDIWVIQEAGTNGEPARVLKLSGTDGHIIAEAHGAATPRAVTIDNQGRLLVADAGPDSDIKIFGPQGDALGTFGAKGGIFAGKGSEIGLWGPARFERPRGVGVDRAGNIYVLSAGGAWPQVGRLEAYAPQQNSWGGQPLWTAMGMMFGDIAVPDPHDENTYYTSCAKLHMDWHKSAGQEWSYLGATLNPNRYPQDPRVAIFTQGGAARSTFGIRYIAGHRFLFSGLNNVEISRFNPGNQGEIGIPSVYIAMRDPAIDRAAPGWPPAHPARAPWLWTDKNGDGQFEPEEFESFAPQRSDFNGAAHVDQTGNLWWFNRNTFTAWELPVESGLDAQGNPVYRPARLRSLPLPSGYVKSRVMYLMDDRNGDLYVAGVRPGDAAYSLARYPGWLENQNVMPVWSIANIADHERHEIWKATASDIGALAIAGDYVFVGSALGNGVRVYRTADGAAVGKMSGPDSPGTLDEQHSFGAYLRQDGEYDIFKIDFVHNRNTLFRWHP